MGMLLWSDDVTDDRWTPLFGRLRATGYDFVEVPVFRAEPARYRALAGRRRGLGLEATAVTALGAGQDLLSADPEVRRAGVEHLLTAVDCAAELGSPLLGGPVYQALGVFSGAAPSDDERARAVEALYPVAEYAQASGLKIALEPLNRFEVHLVNTAADARALVDAVGHPALGLAWDSFHAHIEERDLAAALASCGDALLHVQASENHRGTPGKGQVDWATTMRTLRAMGYAGRIAVEAFGQGLPALAAATRVWRRLYDDEESLAADALCFLRAAWDAGAP